MEWTEEQVSEYVKRSGGDEEVARVLTKVMNVLVGEKFSKIVDAFGMYMFMEGYYAGWRDHYERQGNQHT